MKMALIDKNNLEKVEGLLNTIGLKTYTYKKGEFRNVFKFKAIKLTKENSILFAYFFMRYDGYKVVSTHIKQNDPDNNSYKDFTKILIKILLKGHFYDQDIREGEWCVSGDEYPIIISDSIFNNLFEEYQVPKEGNVTAKNIDSGPDVGNKLSDTDNESLWNEDP